MMRKNIALGSLFVASLLLGGCGSGGGDKASDSMASVAGGAIKSGTYKPKGAPASAGRGGGVQSQDTTTPP